MNVLVLSGSPLENGNISNMAKIAVDAAKKAGNNVKAINIYNQKIGHCVGCMKCRKTGICILKDDYDYIRKLIVKCDMLVIAAPVYFANVPAPVKNLFDRLSGAVMDTGKYGIPKGRFLKSQKYILMTTCATPAPFDRIFGQSTGALKAMKEVFKTGGMTYLGSVVFAGTTGKSEIPLKIKRKIQRFWI